MSLIFVHEMGHFLTSKLLKWKTDKICIYPLGGVTVLNDDINKSLKEEFLILITGPIFQMIFYQILILNNVKDITFFNYFLLIFNLLPVYPLDGGKILNIILSYIMAYKKSLKITICISFFFYFIELFLFIKIFNSVFLFISLFFLIFKIIDEKNKIDYYFNKFLLERYLKKYSFKKIKYVNNVLKMQKEKEHFIYKDGKILNEKTFLNFYFNDKGYKNN